jgi:metal-responsive CopG/Arc/MetJ family transcriptional regulator
VTRTAIVVVRMKPSGLAVIDDLAQAEKVKRSEMIRRLLGEAITARQQRRPPPDRSWARGSWGPGTP